MTATAPAPTYAPVPIGDLCEFLNGGTPSKANVDFWNGDIPWITSAEINDGEVAPPRFKITQDAIDESSTRLVPAGTLLLVIRTGVGKVGIAPYDLTFNQDINAVLPDPKRLDKQYLRRFLESQGDHFDKFSRGATVKGITREHLGRLAIPIPFPDDPRRSLAEQKRIAAILDKADAIRRRRQEAARLADTLIPSVFYEMFGDPVTNAKKWPTESLDKVAQLDRGRSRHRPRDWAPLYGGPYPLIQTGDIANCNGVIRKYTQTYSEEGLAQSKLWPKGTLCITIAANIGKTGILAFDACFPDSVVGLVAGPSLTIEYVREWFVAIQKNLDDSAPQVAQKNINLAILNALQIPVPPKPLQERFSQVVESVRASQERAAGVDAEAGTLFNSLVHRAFRGEL